MSRQCKCGGVIRSHGLTGDREAWTCGTCGTYSVIDRRRLTDEYIEAIAKLGHDRSTFDSMRCRCTLNPVLIDSEREVPVLAPERQAMHEAMCDSSASSLESMRRRWLSDSFDRGSQTIEEAEASAEAMRESMDSSGILLHAPAKKS